MVEGEQYDIRVYAENIEGYSKALHVDRPVHVALPASELNNFNDLNLVRTSSMNFTVTRLQWSNKMAPFLITMSDWLIDKEAIFVTNIQKNQTISGVPDPPSGGIRVRKVDKDSVDLEWGAPRYDGGSRLQGYVIDFREGDSFKWNRSATCDAVSLLCFL